ncbi:transcription factor subunit 2 [Trypanosoma rangeli]|uniref:Transcription factor subunit 2 n=1 Tax=Trypanosoma rangeli TaxID=5698 RepID=A0A422N8X2_TRYRA|nr:transcription factor subunit 2 [Trypanosoma rangeli]RNF01910.1 transcription factor subunit 2 [Trypanosoma rangeli]|eukprot:RNF01910.1 transcription factor subunit 2 [Trypanosoma rangeli]
MDPWQPSLPGAGAQRAVLILQLYMRMGHYSPLSILVADTLCLTFKAAGATVSELGAYLGLSPDRVEIGIEGMPKELYCTSAELRQNATSGEYEEKNTGKKRSRQEATEENTLRYYINYATLLPFAFAHGSHMLLALCQLPRPQCATNDSISGEHISLNVSATLRRSDFRRGLCCVSCRYWMALKDLRSTISRCPLCHTDILGGVLRAIYARYEEKLASGQSLLSFGPVQQRPTTITTTTTTTSKNNNSSCRAMEAAQGDSSKMSVGEAADYPLARDPFLVQQGLFFQLLFSHPFVRVNDAPFVVDEDEVMTKEEYDHRLKHRATVLDQFRLVHRNAAAIRVKRVDQQKLDAEKCRESTMKVVKRGQLPPWLRPVSVFQEGEVPLPPATRREQLFADNVEFTLVKETKRGADITATARYTAQEFFDDDYDEVPLCKLSTG